MQKTVLHYRLPIHSLYGAVYCDHVLDPTEQALTEYAKTLPWVQSISPSRLIIATEKAAQGYIVAWYSPIHGYRPLETRERIIPVFRGHKGRSEAIKQCCLIETGFSKIDTVLRFPQGFNALTIAPVMIS